MVICKLKENNTDFERDNNETTKINKVQEDMLQDRNNPVFQLINSRNSLANENIETNLKRQIADKKTS